ncbi:hypothetical protein O181_085112 [Austropuccinia psidii MF-1]|uniref:Uncharacterized protein n=1 Tax=Austropuccinia psidii MF-1 TaxID=1389203 RepID=A0A9Q3ILG0_9BASI|nr:hypothetical protein [Austropuccinia psidii MF-1]
MMVIKAVEVLDPDCTEGWEKGKDYFQHYNSRSSKCHFSLLGRRHVIVLDFRLPILEDIYGVRRMGLLGRSSQFLRPLPLIVPKGIPIRDVARWTNVGGPIPVSGRPIYSSSEVPISRINNEGVVKRLRQIAYSPPDPDAEDSDELDGEEVEVVYNSVGHQSSTSPSNPLAKRFQSHIIPSTPRTFQSTLATIPASLPTSSPSSSTTRPALIPAVRPSPIHQSRNSPIITSKQLQPVASSSRRREELSSFLFPATQVFQKRDCWPIRVTREDPNMESKNQGAVARFFRRVNGNSREVIEYANDRTFPGTASKEMAEKFAWYKDELINDFQRTFDHLGRDNYFLVLLCVWFEFYPHSY